MYDTLAFGSGCIGMKTQIYSLMHICDEASSPIVTDIRQILKWKYFTDLLKRKGRGQIYNIPWTYHQYFKNFLRNKHSKRSLHATKEVQAGTAV